MTSHQNMGLTKDALKEAVPDDANRLARECAKLDKAEERALAEEQ
jgi:hypothetical protein